jgi:hypothetical protein
MSGLMMGASAKVLGFAAKGGKGSHNHSPEPVKRSG